MNETVSKVVEAAGRARDKVLEAVTGLTAEQRERGGGGTVELTLRDARTVDLHPQGYSPDQDVRFKKI